MTARLRTFCLALTVGMLLWTTVHAVADDAAHPILTDDPANEQWHAPASRPEAVYTGQAQGEPTMLVRPDVPAAQPLTIEIYSDANAVAVTRGEVSFEFPIAPNRKNSLVLDASDDLPTISLNGQQLIQHQGSWIRAMLKADAAAPLRITFKRGTWCNLSLTTRESPKVQRVVLKRRENARELKNSVLPNEYVPHSSADEEDAPTTEPLTPSAGYNRILMSERNRVAMESRGLTTLAAAPPTEPAPATRTVVPGKVAPPTTDRPLLGESVMNWRIDLQAGVTSYSAVYYNGIHQENQDLIFQVYADGSLTIWQDEAGKFFNRISLETGLLTSHFDGPTGGGRLNSNSKLVEMNVYGGIGATILDRWEVQLYPRQRIRTDGVTPALTQDVHSVELRIAFDDSTPAYQWSLQPHVMVLLEYEGTSDRVRAPGTRTSTYLELGMAPEMELFRLGPRTPVLLQLPMRIGLSLDDYYQDPRNGDDDVFGFFEFGADLSIPVLAVTTDDGSRAFNFRIITGIHVLIAGDSLQQINIAGGGTGNDVEVFGFLGAAMDY